MTLANKASTVFKSLIARIFLIVSYALCLLTFILAAAIMLGPNYNSDALDYGYWHLASAGEMTTKPTQLSPAGIAVMILWAFSLVLSIITIIGLKKSNYTIGKNNKVTRVFWPVNFAILVVVIIGLLSQPNLIHIGSSFSLISRHWGAEIQSGSWNFSNYTVAGYVFFAITICLALGIVFDIIGFVLRIFLSRSKEKAYARD